METPFVYRFSGGSWDTGTALTGKPLNNFGTSSSMSSDGNTIVVTGQGSMATPIVYRFSDGSWDTGTALTGKPINNFGTSSAMSSDGNTIVVTGFGSMETPFVYRALTQTQTTTTVPPPPFTFTGLTPSTAYTFSITPSNASVNGPPTNLGTVYNTLFEPIYLTYTGTVETKLIPPGNYRITMAGGSGPERDPSLGGGRCFGDFTYDYTVTSPIIIQYAIGQASPGDAGGAGGTYMYDTTNSQWLFVAGGAGTNNFSPVPDFFLDPGDGSGGAAGSGGGSGAGVNSNGSNSTASGGSGGLTFGNGATGGSGGGAFGASGASGGFGGGGGGARLIDFILGTVYYPGGGGGYTGGTTTTNYVPGDYANWSSTPGTSYAIAGATFYTQNSSVGTATPVTDGYITIIINPDL
jgi:hypothetical protein